MIISLSTEYFFENQVNIVGDYENKLKTYSKLEIQREPDSLRGVLMLGGKEPS